ncbi:hypothetical protein [Photorhabdus stackebrandtii]|uniref:Uncharacterized protein n=1 Tax=Photorhabdus stackebrandtii TaxID=1123042 RepID=A0A7X5QQ93_9GAMM|nr:hypothetical protein [Photorhabdus stackebrandtii]NHB98556.1 hypothetical protein [Photorhabdus stackebrandtii]
MQQTLSKFEIVTSENIKNSCRIYSATFDNKLVKIKNNNLYNIYLNRIVFSLAPLLSYYKSVQLETMVTIRSGLLALVAIFDGRDCLSFILLRNNHILMEIDDILGNYCLIKGSFTYTRISEKNSIYRFNFFDYETVKLFEGDGFCTPIRYYNNGLCLLIERRNTSSVILFNEICNEYNLICQDKTLLSHNDNSLIFIDYSNY